MALAVVHMNSLLIRGSHERRYTLRAFIKNGGAMHDCQCTGKRGRYSPVHPSSNGGPLISTPLRGQ